MHEDIEDAGGELLPLVEDVEVLLEDERELLGTHAGEDDGLGEGVHEELLRVGLQGKELGEHSNLVEEQQTVLIVALAAIS